MGEGEAEAKPHARAEGEAEGAAGEGGEAGEAGEGAGERTCGRDGCPLKPWHSGLCLPTTAAEGAPGGEGGEAADGGRRSSRRAASIEAEP